MQQWDWIGKSQQHAVLLRCQTTVLKKVDGKDGSIKYLHVVVQLFIISLHGDMDMAFTSGYQLNPEKNRYGKDVKMQHACM
jgi:hypothetical protein